MKKKLMVILIIMMIALMSPPSKAASVNWKEAANVPVDKVWSIKFNKTLDRSSVNNNTVYIVDSKNNKVNTVLGFTDNDMTVTVDAVPDYLPGQQYFLYITEEVGSKGYHNKNKVAMSFTTGLSKTVLVYNIEIDKMNVGKFTITTDMDTDLSAIKTQITCNSGITWQKGNDNRTFIGTINGALANHYYVLSFGSSIKLKQGLEPVVSWGELQASDIASIAGPSVCYIEVYDRDGHAVSSGSCIIIGSDGKILTNRHVVFGACSAKIRMTNGRILDVVSVLAIDKERDIAILKVNADNLPALKLGDSGQLINGQKVLAIGSPEGLENSISDGLVSNKNRVIYGYNFIQITTPISPGSSGGALLNYNSEVVGVTSCTITDGQNINLAIPINEVKPFLNSNLNISLLELAGRVTVETLVYDDRIYIGEVRYNKPDGKGKAIFNNGNTYEGQFVEGHMTGQGISIWLDGSKYEGDHVDGYMEGNGTYYWPDGDTYVGQFSNGQLSGHGVYTWFDGDRFEGEFVNSKMNGQGTYYYKNGDTYVGEFVNDCSQGYGTYTFANGNTYIGYFANGTYNGYGVYTDASTKEVKKGFWKDGVYTGD